MNHPRGPSRLAAAHATNNATSTGSNPNFSQYGGEGAPHGNPFEASAPVGGPVYHDSRSLGYGLLPGTPTATRSTSLNTPRPLARDRSNPARAASLNTLPTVNSYTPVYNPSLLATPTPSNRYHAPSRPPPPLMQSAIPEERPQMDRLLDMMQRLLDDTAELKERMSFVETTLFEVQTSSPARGIAAQRGGRITRSKSGAPSSRRSRVADESDVATSQSSTTDVSMDTDIEPQSMDEDGVDLDAIDVTDKEHRALQSYVTKTFRRVCSVPGRNWPDPNLVRTNATTNEVYPTPVFNVTVNDHRNKRVFHEVARQAFLELQNHEARPMALKRDIQFDLAFLEEMAKESFRSLKKKWRETQQIEAAINADTDRRNNRRLKRRQRKSQRLFKILNAFAAQHGLDPAFLADLIHEQFLSDEASGPEDDSGESKEAWKVRLSAAANLSLHADAQKELKILEILVPAWRSTGYSGLIRDMQLFLLNDATSDQELQYHRVPTAGRVSDRIPRFAPYDFGISIQWWKENCQLPTNKKVLKDWFKWAEPDNCGLSFDRNGDGEILNTYYTQSQQ
ncbi:hypothetical protein B0H10DRAFT_1986071 [Mycena sp. CBHHK59/15]|nr:hypothetical protein B0H10DRAFT_1986071 [Mycena sp. CBHHK59/15]